MSAANLLKREEWNFSKLADQEISPHCCGKPFVNHMKESLGFIS